MDETRAANPSIGGLDVLANGSQQQWEIELNQVLAGSRDHLIRPLGSAAEYVEIVIRRSKHPAPSRVHFLHALSAVVTAWSPDRNDPPDELSYMFDLLERYTPPIGFGKIIDFARRVKHMPRRNGPYGIDPLLRVLHVLERYFPAPPIEVIEKEGETPTQTRAAAFRVYESLLWQFARSPKYSTRVARAVSILMGHRLLTPKDAKFAKLLEEHPETLRAILSVLLSPEWGYRARLDLERTYEICCRRKLERRFAELVADLGARLSYDVDGPTIQPKGDVPAISLTVEPDQVVQYGQQYISDRQGKLASTLQRISGQGVVN